MPLLASADVALNRQTIAYQRAGTELLVFQALIFFFFLLFLFRSTDGVHGTVAKKFWPIPKVFRSPEERTLFFASRDRHIQSFDLEGHTMKQSVLYIPTGGLFPCLK